ncbi:MAG: enoyl-CoA hydratase/isomerase family protein [Gammaproteobacteria bacterium]|nr:MAG: enoyl-CoA hydratase/isomerase family protein [Gammaproteobacteria bacterium]
MSDRLLTDIDRRGVATVTLNRPDVHNAFDDVLIEELNGELEELEHDGTIRVIVLTGAGKSFSAGADLNWMRAMAERSEHENREDAGRFAQLMRRLNELKMPTIARVNGAALGGGVGLVACCDMAIAEKSAIFGLTEVRLGLVPAVIAPYVIPAMGERAARRLFLTGERFDAEAAHAMGLVHLLAADTDSLDRETENMIGFLLEGGPKAQASCKSLIRRVLSGQVGSGLERDRSTATLIARLRASDEGKEGISAFLEKRKPSWSPEKD